MTARSRAAFFVPAILLLLGFSALLFRDVSQAPLVTTLFWVFVLISALLQTTETAVVFAVLITGVEFIASAQASSIDKLWILAQVPCLWGAVYAAHLFHLREVSDAQVSSEILTDRQVALQNLHKEKEALSKRLGELSEQAALRQYLFDAVQQMSSVLDPVLVRQRLMEFVRSSIGKGTIQFFAGQVPRDPLDRWVMERKISLLVTDVNQDGRFNKGGPLPNEVRSVLAAPIVVEKQWVGLVRVNGFEPDLFSISDLRILEALSLMAALALENLQLLHKLKEGAVRDNLTGLYTHKFFEERLNEEILSAGRFQTSFGLLLLDIDHFKRYNDTYGHQAGDEVLIRFSQVLQKLARSVDLVARYGGEEFTLLIPQVSADQTRAMAEQIRQAIEAEVFQFGTEEVSRERVTVSIGISNFPEEATTASQLVRVADTRLYQAKQGGRNQVVG